MACHMLLYVKVKFCYEDYKSYEEKTKEGKEYCL